MKKILFLSAIALFLLGACNFNSSKNASLSNEDAKSIANAYKQSNDTTITKIVKTEAEWKKELSAEQFHVLREKGTEQAFTGKYWDNHDKGVFACSACHLPLFASDTKFESGTGWPSFWQPIKKGYVAELKDESYGMVRTEVVCGRCGGHLGHVFEDGPEPTGLRYCLNSVSLDFEKRK